MIVFSPGWDEFHSAFLNWDVFKASFPDIAHAFLLNVKIFCIAEPIILVLALVVAVVRGLPGPVFAPLRGLAIAYADVFRGVPTILVILMLGFGMPALGLSWIPTSETFWGIVALVLVYTAYVSEVYRAGLESVHPSQEAAARSLGLTRFQGLRYVIVPQAVRRVIPPLAERLHRAPEGHGARQRDRRRRGAPAGLDRGGGVVQLHALRGGGGALRRDHDPAHAVHGLPDRPRAVAPAVGGGRSMTALALENVHKSFGEHEVLKGIDLAVEEHEVVCLIGASGSGKSTLLRCVNLLEPIDEGRIVIGGREITAPGVDVNAVRRGIGIVFQAFNLFPHMTVLANVTLGPRKALKLPRDEAEQEALELLDRFGLAGRRDDYPDRLSGGQQQRVAILRALAMRPKLLLLDEVTSALDPELVGEVLSLVRELADGGMTMVVATHEMAFAREVANRVCFLDAGRILESGPPAEIFSAPKEPRTQQFLARIVAAGRL